MRHRGRTRRFDATTAHDDDPAGLHRFAVEHAIRMQRDRRGLLRTRAENGASTADAQAATRVKVLMTRYIATLQNQANEELRTKN